jgi:hypothetical protein
MNKIIKIENWREKKNTHTQNQNHHNIIVVIKWNNKINSITRQQQQLRYKMEKKYIINKTLLFLL